MLEGIDTSKWEGKLDPIKAVTAGSTFLYVKVSQWGMDQRFQETWNGAKGFMPRGGYHYLDWGLDWLSQARMFCDFLRPDPGELPPCLDLEMKPFAGMRATDVSTRAWNFIQYVEQALGKTPMVYVGYYYWNDWGSNDPKWAKYPLWLPWYTAFQFIVRVPKPWTNWLFWQNTDRADGQKYGCQSLQVDHNFFSGDQTALAKLAGGILPPVVLPPSLPYRVITPCNIRSGPSTAYALLTTAKVGDVLQIKTPLTVVNTYVQLTNNTWVTFKFLQPA
jgi:GH25 family lysozyme M1 (1,4-beta-N-acetylmuramidase)